MRIIKIKYLEDYIEKHIREKTRTTNALFKTSHKTGKYSPDFEFSDKEKYSYWKGYKRALNDLWLWLNDK